MKKLKISGVGCTLMDYVYNHISFESEGIQPFLSKKDGDGGISPGKLVFTEELESFAGISYPEMLHQITGGRKPDTMNIGGPAVVSMIHAAQLLGDDAEIFFTGAIGEDETGINLLSFLKRTALDPGHIVRFNLPTPFTHVLSDPDYDSGHGERSFINNIGAAGRLSDLPEEFFEADICVFGGTALVPNIHDNLDVLLGRAKENKAFTIVNTVYDFRNEKANPGKAWPLGKGHESLDKIDLLIMDLEESLKISGKDNGDSAMDYFRVRGVKGIVITEGAKDIRAYASPEIFKDEIDEKFPVSQKVVSDLKCSGVKGDTTGCGDNFVGGMIYSLAEQMIKHPCQKPAMEEMVRWGRASGGFACFYLGGTYFEKERGEKLEKVKRYLE
jgi:sugar/nucleoside kinase (ribokinase family)